MGSTDNSAIMTIDLKTVPAQKDFVILVLRSNKRALIIIACCAQKFGNYIQTSFDQLSWQEARNLPCLKLRLKA